MWSPAAMGGHPPACAGVGSAKARANQSATIGWKGASGVGEATAIG